MKASRFLWRLITFRPGLYLLNMLFGTVLFYLFPLVW